MILLNDSTKGDALFVSRILKEMSSRHQPFTAQPKPQYDRSLARTWTVELKQRKIRVNAISPGPIDTPILGVVQTDEQIEQLKSLVASVPMGRMSNPDEVAKAVSFLASDDSSFVTGIELFVDGAQI
jgi:NAD(P)-dependent dehydrogenase (short-subunit alcohol dehydrogenase family)